jgi:arylsulfatase A-like enzyme
MTGETVMDKKTIINVLALGIIGSFCISLVYALIHIIPHRYLSYGMYRLCADILREQFNDWFLLSLLTVGAVILLRNALRWSFLLTSSVDKQTGSYKDEHSEKKAVNATFAATLPIMMLCLLLVSTGWVMVDIFSFELFRGGSIFLVMIVLLGSFIPKTQRGFLHLIKLLSLPALVFLLCLNLGITVTNSRAVMPGPNIILFAIDCLRPDHLGFNGYQRETSPAIDRLAQNGVVCTNAYTNAPWTKPSVATLFTSFYPQGHGVLDPSQALSNAALTAAELLGNGGYRTLFFNGGNPFIDERFNFSQGFDYYQYFSRTEHSGADLTYAFLSQLETTKHQKFFAYLHYMDTHAPYTNNNDNRYFYHQPDGREVISGNNTKCNIIRTLTANNALTEQHKKEIIALYDGQIRYVDENIERILAFLKEKQLLKNTVVIVTADHGEEFWEHNNYEHGHTLYNEILRIPLIISGWTIEPSEVKTGVSLLDVLPTLLDIAGITYGNLVLQGTSIFKAVNHTANSDLVPVFATGTLYGNEKYCLIRGAKKMIITTDSKKKKWNLIGYSNDNRCELYNTNDDREERDSLICAYDEEGQSMKKDLELFFAMTNGFQRESEVSEVTLDKTLKERLGSLGYLE